MEKKHKLFILSNMQTLMEFNRSSLMHFYNEAKEKNETNQILLYSGMVSINMEMIKMINAAIEMFEKE
jgi:hypothetical protein